MASIGSTMPRPAWVRVRSARLAPLQSSRLVGASGLPVGCQWAAGGCQRMGTQVASSLEGRSRRFVHAEGLIGWRRLRWDHCSSTCICSPLFLSSCAGLERP